MIQPARFPDPETTIAMNPQHPHPNEDPTPAQGEGSPGSPTAVAPTTKPNSARRRIEHPMQAILGAVVVLLLGFALTQTNDRISRLDDRVSRLEDTVDSGFAHIDDRFAQQDAKFDERFASQDARLDEINLKLTALIAALNATAEVEAALEGRLLAPNAATTDTPAN